ncbi:29529_t:CDS:2, partial [Racocetra persica]
MKTEKLMSVTSKAYEVRYVTIKKPSKLAQLASHLVLKTVENCRSCPADSLGRDKNFHLTITLKNFLGSSITKEVYDVTIARGEIEKLANQVDENIHYHLRRAAINESCYVAGEFLGGDFF